MPVGAALARYDLTYRFIQKIVEEHFAGVDVKIRIYGLHLQHFDTFDGSLWRWDMCEFKHTVHRSYTTATTNVLLFQETVEGNIIYFCEGQWHETSKK